MTPCFFDYALRVGVRATRRQDGARKVRGGSNRQAIKTAADAAVSQSILVAPTTAEATRLERGQNSVGK